MAFEIRIKPLVLFDLEDRIRNEEKETNGAGRKFYENFLTELDELQYQYQSTVPVYESIKKYKTKRLSCQLFYMIDEKTIFIMGIR